MTRLLLCRGSAAPPPTAPAGLMGDWGPSRLAGPFPRPFPQQTSALPSCTSTGPRAGIPLGGRRGPTALPVDNVKGGLPVRASRYGTDRGGGAGPAEEPFGRELRQGLAEESCGREPFGRDLRRMLAEETCGGEFRQGLEEGTCGRALRHQEALRSGSRESPCRLGCMDSRLSAPQSRRDERESPCSLYRLDGPDSTRAPGRPGST
jgi:hypothetical protein